MVGWIETSYPNFSSRYIIHIETFTERNDYLKTRAGYEDVASTFGMRRTKEGFCTMAEWSQEKYRREKPVLGCILYLIVTRAGKRSLFQVLRFSGLSGKINVTMYSNL